MIRVGQAGACVLGLLGAGCLSPATETDPATLSACTPPTDCAICEDPDEGPCSIDPECACECVWAAGELPRPWWLDAPPAECGEHPAHDPIQAYDDCAGNPEGSTPEQCGAPSTGAVVCVGNGFSGLGRRTQLCLTASDCPEGMLCVDDGVPGDVDPNVTFSGYCEAACAGNGAEAECVRCDMGCNVDVGVCQPRQWPPPVQKPCVADCQCDGVCLGGYCNDESGIPRIGLCGPGNDCPCNGGSCEGECCILPGGDIAQRGDPACQP